MIRSATPAEHLADLEFERVDGDITDRRAVRRAVDGAERVFHVAGTTSMRPGSPSSAAATTTIGPAPPQGRADETQAFPAAARGITYVYSKHEAEGEALRVAAHGLDVVIVNPTFVLGPEDPSGTSMRLVKRFLKREIPVYIEGGVNISDVRDVAQGQILADERGVPGERYLLAARNFTLQRLFADLERISGVPAPTLRLPSGLARAGAGAIERLALPVPVSADEVRSASLWWTYTPAKAKRELGYQPRPREETLVDAVAWQSEQLGDRVGRSPGITDLALGAARRAGRLAGWLNPSHERGGAHPRASRPRAAARSRPLPLPDSDGRALPLRCCSATPAQARAAALGRARALPSQQLASARDRGADPAASGPGPDRRRGDRARFEADPGVSGVALRGRAGYRVGRAGVAPGGGSSGGQSARSALTLLYNLKLDGHARDRDQDQ